MRGVSLAILVIGCAAGAPAAGRGPAPAAGAAGHACEMHVWADAHVTSDISGIFPGGVLASLETGPYREAMKRGKTNVLKLVVTPELLLEGLKESRIGRRLGIAPDRFILEPDKATQRAFRKSPTSPAEGCRYGFSFNIVQFQKSTVYGRRLVIFYNIIDRTTSPKPRNMQWYNSEKLSAFDPKADDREIAAVLRDGVRRVVDDIVAKRFPEPGAATGR